MLQFSFKGYVISLVKIVATNSSGQVNLRSLTYLRILYNCTYIALSFVDF